MIDANIENFLTTFDDSRFPDDFLQQYELMECFSHNEIGETLLIKDRQTGMQYVAKCYPYKFHLSNTTESDLLKKLHHPGLPVYTGEYHNGKMLCVVREYTPGKSLNRLVPDHPLTRQLSISVAVQLAEILVYLHGQTPPIIHRDIKPQNIIVDEQGKITLIDFGISRIYDERSQEDTFCLGTRHYAAPEQYGFSQTDCRSDIYSYGVLLCWLMTGTEDVKQARKNIRDHRMVHIIEKCCAFAPKDRFKSAAQVRDALTGRTARRHLLSLLSAALIIFAAVLLSQNILKAPTQLSLGIHFKEPLIEQAVRLALGKDTGEEISEQDLFFIKELFIFGDKAAPDEETFNGYAKGFANNDGTVLRGNIHALDDLTKLKRLRRVSLVYQTITDLAPLAGLTDLEYVDLRHNPIEDVSSLSQLPLLTSLSLFDTHVSNLTALHDCTHLSMVDAGYTRVQSMAAFEGLDALRILVVRKAPLQSIDQIGNHPMLEQVFLSKTLVVDLSPLLDLPNLQLVEVDENMHTVAEAIAQKAQFKITYP